MANFTSSSSTVQEINAVNLEGNVAHDAVDSGNPIKIGGKASSSIPTAVSDGDRVNAYYDPFGRQYVVGDGGIAHDAVDSGNPLKFGGKAYSGTPLPVDSGDRVNGFFDQYGRLHVVVDGAISSTSVGKFEDAPHTTGDSGTFVLAVANEAQSNISGTDGDYTPIGTNRKGTVYTQETLVPNYELQTEGLAATHPAGMATSTKAITRFGSTALEASRVIKASAGRLYELMGRVDKTAPTADYWVQILNAASLPADGAVTFLDKFKIVHTNGVDNVFDFTDNFGAYGSSGLVVCLSTTEFTKTISGAYLSITGKYA